MSNSNYSTRVGAGPQAAIPPALLLTLGLTEGDYIDFDFVDGTWQIFGRHQVSTNYFASPTKMTLLERLRRSVKEHVQFKHAAEIPTEERSISAKAGHE